MSPIEPRILVKNQDRMEQTYIILVKEFNSQIAGSDNIVAEAFSRSPMMTGMHIRGTEQDSDYYEPYDTDHIRSRIHYKEEEIIGSDYLNKIDINGIDRRCILNWNIQTNLSNQKVWL